MWQALGNFFWEFIPQKNVWHGDWLWKWCWRSVALTLSAFIMASYGIGLISWTFHLPMPYATAAELNEVKKTNDSMAQNLEIMKKTLDGILDANKEQSISDTYDRVAEYGRQLCRAKNSRDDGAKPLWMKRFTEMKLKYYQLTGVELTDFDDCKAF